MNISKSAEYIPGQVAISPEMIASCFMLEIRELANVMALPGFSDIWHGFSDYSGFIKKNNKRVKNVYKSILNASNNTCIVDIDTGSQELLNAFARAHVAACCELLAGIRMDVDKLTPLALYQFANNYLSGLQSESEAVKQNIMHKISTMDAVRTMHLLRNMGLISKSVKNIYQLALGAGSGWNDIYSLHKTPEIISDKSKVKPGSVFNIAQEQVAQIVISDSDSRRERIYQEYNQKYSPQIFAYNEETSTVLNRFKSQDLKKRNLITALRLDHRMIPDASEFLGSLITCVDDECDMIITIGSGDKPEDLEGRISIIEELFKFLESARLRPVLFKLHKPGNILEQYKSLRYGNPLTSTYQILYCKLKKRELIRVFRN